MVRGLLIRQALTAINLLFAVVIAYIIYLVGVQQFAAPPAEQPLDIASNAANDVTFKRIGPRSDYDTIVNGKLFGEAGAVAAAPVAPPPVSETVVDTTAPVKLLATVASTPTDPLATAIIENTAATTPNKTSTYYLNQMVTDNLKLIEVHRRRVILLDTAKNQKQKLEMAQLGSATTMAKSTPGSMRNAKLAAGAQEKDDKNHVTIDRKTINDELGKTSYEDIMAQLNPTLVEDEKGNVTGITSASLSSFPLAKSAGLQDNDVIQAVNGISIDSEQKILEIANKVGTANTIRLSVLRENKPQMITLKVQ